MALLKTEIQVNLFPEIKGSGQRVKIRPKKLQASDNQYTCPLCSQLAGKMSGLLFQGNIYDNDFGEFKEISFSEGTKNCPCCGININWI